MSKTTLCGNTRRELTTRRAQCTHRRIPMYTYVRYLIESLFDLVAPLRRENGTPIDFVSYRCRQLQLTFLRMLKVKGRVLVASLSFRISRPETSRGGRDLIFCFSRRSPKYGPAGNNSASLRSANKRSAFHILRRVIMI